MTENGSDWLKRLLAEMGPMSNDPNRRVWQQIEFDKRYQEAKKAEQERRSRIEQQAALEDDLAHRSRLYLDHTGTSPSTALLEQWRDEYVSRQARHLQTEREARIARSIQENYRF
jgi:hypothetical protein